MNTKDKELTTLTSENNIKDSSIVLFVTNEKNNNDNIELNNNYDILKKKYNSLIEENRNLNNITKSLTDNIETIMREKTELLHKTYEMINKNETRFSNQISIENMLEENRLDDLERFISRRKCFNKWNIYMIYFFYLIQSSGILLSSVGASMNYQIVLWLGIGLNTLAGIVQIYEKVNDTQLKKLYKDIVSIKDNKYICEAEAIDVNILNQTISSRANNSHN